MNEPSPTFARGNRSLDIFVFGFEEPGQFQLVAGGHCTVGKARLQLEQFCGRLATQSAARDNLCGAVAYIQGGDCIAISVPSSVSERLSGRSGLSLTFGAYAQKRGRLSESLSGEIILALLRVICEVFPGDQATLSTSLDPLTRALQASEKPREQLSRLDDYVESLRLMFGSILDGQSFWDRWIAGAPVRAHGGLSHSKELVPVLILSKLLIRSLRRTGRPQIAMLLPLHAPPPTSGSVVGHQFVDDGICVSQVWAE